MWKCLGYEFVDREPDFGFITRSALAYSACKMGIFTPVRQETLSRIAEIGRGSEKGSRKRGRVLIIDYSPFFRSSSLETKLLQSGNRQ